MNSYPTFIFIIVIPLFLLGLLTLGKILFKNLTFLLPITILGVWWLFFIWLSNFSFTGIYIPSIKTQFSVLLLVFGMFIGGGGFLYFYKSRINFKNNFQPERDLFKILKIIYLSISPIILFYFFRSMNYLWSSGGNFETYRMVVFGSKEGASVLFRSGPLELLYYITVYPLLLFTLFLATSMLLTNQNQKRSWIYFSLSAFLLSLDGIMRLGRFNLYYILVVFFLYLIISFIKFSIRKFDVKAILIKTTLFILFISMIFAIGALREKKSSTIANQFNKYFIEYHTTGFLIFDDELQNQNSYLNTHLTFGRGTLGGLDQLLGLFVRKVGWKNFETPAQKIAYDMQFPRQVGVSREGGPILYNAFSTVLYTLYLDGRFLFIFFIPLLYGFFVTKLWFQIISMDVKVDRSSYFILKSALFIFLIWVGIFSLFQSPIESPAVWIVFFLLQSTFLGIKRSFDLAFSLLLILLLFFPFLLILLLVKISELSDWKAPVLYWSKRIGQNEIPFLMPKVRTMKRGAPQVATHLLKNPKLHLTPLGSFLRKCSLDEVPQLWSILRGEMSFVGPRPALFNQEDLIELRMKKGVSALLPGLTGLAQIMGRDELSLKEKVKYDEFYLRHQSFLFDLKIILLTLGKVFDFKRVAH